MSTLPLLYFLYIINSLIMTGEMNGMRVTVEITLHQVSNVSSF